MSTERHISPRLTGIAAAASILLAALASAGCAGDNAGAAGTAVSTPAADPVASLVRATAKERAASGRTDFSAPSLAFPAGTSYAEGLRQVFMMEAGGPDGAGATLTGALPKGAVLGVPGPGEPLRISLAAPYGYDTPSGRPLLPPLRAPAKPTRELSAAGPWVKGSALPVPALPECMISRTGAAPPPCSDDDVVRLEGEAIPLP